MTKNTPLSYELNLNGFNELMETMVYEELTIDHINEIEKFMMAYADQKAKEAQIEVLEDFWNFEKAIWMEKPSAIDGKHEDAWDMFEIIQGRLEQKLNQLKDE